jgi:hypothetical protein
MYFYMENAGIANFMTKVPSSKYLCSSRNHNSQLNLVDNSDQHLPKFKQKKNI